MTRRDVGLGLERDHDVVIGYPAERITAPWISLGSDARVRSGSVLYEGTSIGNRLQTGHHVIIREGCVIGDDVAIWSNSVVDYSCRIGDRVKIHCNCYIAQFTEIQDDAFLAPGVTVANDLYPGQADSQDVMSGPWIGPGAQIGVNVTLLPYVRVGAGCLVGAGAVVTHDLPAGTVAYGNPAVVRGDVADLRHITTRVQQTGSASKFRFAATSPVTEDAGRS
jgi:acetyltransferase-like isoleucine patch superfamily enzyme